MTANRSLSIIPTVQFWLIKLLRQCTYRISGFDPEAPYSVDDPPFCQEINQIALDNAIEALGRFPLSGWSVKPFKLSWNIDFGSLWNSWNPIWNGRRQSCHRWAKLARIRSQIWTGYEWRPDRQSSQSISRFPWIFSSTDVWLRSYIDTTPMIWIYYPLCRAKNGPEKNWKQNFYGRNTVITSTFGCELFKRKNYGSSSVTQDTGWLSTNSRCPWSSMLSLLSPFVTCKNNGVDLYWFFERKSWLLNKYIIHLYGLVPMTPKAFSKRQFWRKWFVRARLLRMSTSSTSWIIEAVVPSLKSPQTS